MWQSSSVPVLSFGSSGTFINTVELHLSGLIGTASRPDMRKIRIIGFLLENRLHWQLEVEKEFCKRLFRHIFIYVQIKHEYIIRI
jgi:hypothetical protein